jgi:outer membrane lipoprotein carrier protein
VGRGALLWPGLCAFLILSASGTSAALDGPEAIDRLQQEFDRVENLSARFQKVHHWQLVDQTTRLKGRLYVAKPNRFRFETGVQTVAADGTTAWNYVPDNEQVLVSSYGKVRDDRSFEKMLFDLILLGVGEYRETFRARYEGEDRARGSRCHVILLEAREPDRYVSRVRVWVDRRKWVVRRVEYRNINDDVTTYDLWDIEVNRKLAPGLFTFEPPEGVEVVDLR